MYFVGIHWLYELFPTNENLTQCINDPAGWRDAYLGRLGGSSGGFRGGGAVELTDQHSAITAHGFHCEVEGRFVASLDIRGR